MENNISINSYPVIQEIESREKCNTSRFIPAIFNIKQINDKIRISFPRKANTLHSNTTVIVTPNNKQIGIPPVFEKTNHTNTLTHSEKKHVSNEKIKKNTGMIGYRIIIFLKSTKEKIKKAIRSITQLIRNILNYNTKKTPEYNLNPDSCSVSYSVFNTIDIARRNAVYLEKKHLNEQVKKFHKAIKQLNLLELTFDSFIKILLLIDLLYKKTCYFQERLLTIAKSSHLTESTILTQEKEKENKYCIEIEAMHKVQYFLQHLDGSTSKILSKENLYELTESIISIIAHKSCDDEVLDIIKIFPLINLILNQLHRRYPNLQDIRCPKQTYLSEFLTEISESIASMKGVDNKKSILDSFVKFSNKYNINNTKKLRLFEPSGSSASLLKTIVKNSSESDFNQIIPYTYNTSKDKDSMILNTRFPLDFLSNSSDSSTQNASQSSNLSPSSVDINLVDNKNMNNYLNTHSDLVIKDFEIQLKDDCTKKYDNTLSIRALIICYEFYNKIDNYYKNSFMTIPTKKSRVHDINKFDEQCTAMLSTTFKKLRPQDYTKLKKLILSERKLIKLLGFIEWMFTNKVEKGNEKKLIRVLALISFLFNHFHEDTKDNNLKIEIIDPMKVFNFHESRESSITFLKKINYYYNYYMKIDMKSKYGDRLNTDLNGDLIIHKPIKSNYTLPEPLDSEIKLLDKLVSMRL